MVRLKGAFSSKERAYISIQLAIIVLLAVLYIAFDIMEIASVQKYIGIIHGMLSASEINLLLYAVVYTLVPLISDSVFIDDKA